jgi:hypothetical protein
VLLSLFVLAVLVAVAGALWMIFSTARGAEKVDAKPRPGGASAPPAEPPKPDSDRR